MHAYTQCMRACARAFLPLVFLFIFFPLFFSCPFPSPSARSTTGGYFFSNRWWPTEAPLFLFHPSSLAFHPFHCFSSSSLSLFLSHLFLSPLFFLFFSLSLFFLQVHPLSPVPLSHRCPIHPPQTRVATCSTLFHLIRGHKLLPRSLYTVEKKEKRERERGKASRSINYFFSFFPFFSLLQPLFAPCLSRFFRAGTLHGVKS